MPVWALLPNINPAQRGRDKKSGYFVNTVANGDQNKQTRDKK